MTYWIINWIVIADIIHLKMGYNKKARGLMAQLKEILV